jgi:aminoglycoside phosphotransferase (APT) family kinase protein
MSKEKFEKSVACVKRMQEIQHPVVFTHGDLKHHDILFHEGHVSGFIDWESAG